MTAFGLFSVPFYAQTVVSQGQTSSGRGSAPDGEKEKSVELSNVEVQGNTVKKLSGVANGEMISTTELFRAACCSLGESFTTNASVDVNYADAATGAKQIKLLGLSGTYVQVLSENIPNYRGAAIPYYLGYIPGPWMQSIQVSKGCSSVKNGYESITGQINVEFKKPQASEFIEGNFYVNTKAKLEANFTGNWHINKYLSTALLLHGEILDKGHDENKDGFMDMPKTKQYGVQSRWAWRDDFYIGQLSIKALKEWRRGGQTSCSGITFTTPYHINIDNDRYEFFSKNAFILNKEHGTNVALILSGSLHTEDASFGLKQYNVDEKNGYASLMFETDFGKQHSLSTGLSLNHDYFKEWGEGWIATGVKMRQKETVPGIYAQYTYKLAERLTFMAGLRADHSSRYGSFVTPRAHIRFVPCDGLTLRASVGKGYRTSYPLAENNYLLASGRSVVIDDDLKQEEAWNYGFSAQYDIKICDKTLNLSAEYYYTHFVNQLVVDVDSDPHAVHFTDLNGKSYSHTLQFEATYPFFRGFTLTGAYRRNIVKCTYGGILMDKPMNSSYKGLITASYKTRLGLWQYDLTLQMNGGGRMPQSYTMADGSQSWDSRFKAYQILNAQITREFRHVAIYVGGENILNFKQKNPIVGADDPWSKNFDSTMIWGPIHGAVYYIGVRLNWHKI